MRKPNKEIIYLLAFNALPKPEPYKKALILEYVGGLEGFIEAIESGKCDNLSPRLLGQIKDDIDLDWAKNEWKRINDSGVSLLIFDDENYPSLLREISDPPIVLYIKGELPSESQLRLAIVGSRRMTHYGQMVTERFSRGLAGAGVIIVSGLARGIDTVAHKGALEAGGTTIAVLGSGLNVRYPPENKRLFERIPEAGAILSEFPMDTPPLPYHFPRRNRIISGLCNGVLVAEATAKSGSLITANLALDQNRSVFAVPGRVLDDTSTGTNRLIQEGATPVISIEEILTDIKGNFGNKLKLNFKEVNIQGDLFDIEEKNKKALKGACDHATRRTPEDRYGLSDLAKEIFGHFDSDPIHIDELANLVEIGGSELYSVIMDLEFRGLVRSLPGMSFVKEIE